MPITSEKFKTDYYFKKQDNRNPIVFIIIKFITQVYLTNPG